MPSLSVNIDLLSGDDVPDQVLSRLKGETDAIRMNGWIWARSGTEILRWPENEAGEAVFRIVAAKEAGSGLVSDPWLEVLSGNPSGVRSPEMKDGISRCVILFEAVPDQGRLLGRNMIADLAPVERGDAMTEVSPGEIALIKICSGHSEEEIHEFAAAVIETVETEAGVPVQAGIGRSVSTLAELKDSLWQAGQALSVGRRFHMAGSVFHYSRQVMERVISAVPAAELCRMRRELFSPETEKLMTDEMMETVQVFFRNDLNLSTAARQLFVHRNTLIYRLDKIRKTTGFDLRKFQDAAVFCLLCRMPAEHEDVDHPIREK